MQTLVQVVCTKGKSLRDAIVNDPKLADFRLDVRKKQQPGRTHGWAKIRSDGDNRQGTLNVGWDAKRVFYCVAW